MNGEEQTLYAVGRIVKAFGIRGEVVVEPVTTVAERLRSLKHVFAGATVCTARPFTVAGVQLDGRGARIRLAEVHDRTSAEHLAGQYLFVREKDRIRPPKGTFFVDDILGLAVVTDDGRTIGTVRDVLHLPAHDVYVVSGEGREVMIPAVREFIRTIDLAARTIRVHVIEGMLE